jgi:aconitate hydratase 2/2-methylisocitrate dehydratase
MGNQEKSSQRRYGDGNLYASFQGRVVEDSEGKKGESLLSSTPVVVLSTILGERQRLKNTKLPKGINLTQFAPLYNYWQISKIVK